MSALPFSSSPFPATPPPLSLYIHLPWCVRKCPYCDFNSHALNDTPLPETEYLAALLKDLSQAAPSLADRPLQTLFIGGGTPNLFSATSIGALLDGIARLFSLASDIEITLEANPGAAETAHFAEYRAVGINRLSLGIQSLDDSTLRTLGRIHNATEARQAIAVALRTFERVNLDFMFALPGQTMATLQQALTEVCDFNASHLSWYQLTLEPNTRFHHAPPANIPDADSAALMQECVETTLHEADYTRYEVSAYAQPGAACVHNLNYWRFGDYLGIGAGAHGKVSFADRIERTVRILHPRRYMEKAQAAMPATALETHRVERSDLAFEFMLNALRLKAGVPRTLFSERTGMPLTEIDAAVQRAIGRGLLDADPQVFRATDLGWRFLNDTVQCFLGDTE